MTEAWQTSVPKYFHADILRADMMLKQAYSARLAGEWEYARELTDKAQAMYQRVLDALPEVPE